MRNVVHIILGKVGKWFRIPSLVMILVKIIEKKGHRDFLGENA